MNKSVILLVGLLFAGSAFGSNVQKAAIRYDQEMIENYKEVGKNKWEIVNQVTKISTKLKIQEGEEVIEGEFPDEFLLAVSGATIEVLGETSIKHEGQFVIEGEETPSEDFSWIDESVNVIFKSGKAIEIKFAPFPKSDLLEMEKILYEAATFSAPEVDFTTMKVVKKYKRDAKNCLVLKKELVCSVKETIVIKATK